MSAVDDFIAAGGKITIGPTRYAVASKRGSLDQAPKSEQAKETARKQQSGWDRYHARRRAMMGLHR